MALHHYWTETVAFTTSNSQFPVAAPFSVETRAKRRSDDSYLRSVWSAALSYSSDGSSNVYGWWATSSVRLTISWDPNFAQSPNDVGAEDPLTLGFVDLKPTLAKLVPPNGYLVDWETAENGLILETARKGNGLGALPGVIGSLFYYDQNGFFSGSAEHTSIRRLKITGRVLWGSSAAA